MRRRPESTTVAPPKQPRMVAVNDRRGRTVALRTVGDNERGALTAAADVLAGPALVPSQVRRVNVQPWQNEVWDVLYEQVGELRFLIDRVARAGSLATFFIAHAGRPGEQPTRVEVDPEKRDPAAETLVDLSDRLFGDGPGTAQAINRALKHLQGNGESILRVSDDDATDGYQLHAHAVQELTGMPGAWKINDGQQTYDLGPSDLLIRSWTPHPQREYLPFSPVRSVMPIAYELIALTKAVAASTDSQLAGAGVVLVPEDAQVVGGGAVTIDEDGSAVISPGAGGLAEEIVEAALTAIKDRDSVAAVAPVVATTTKDMGKLEHITFSTPLDERMGELREEAIRRLALGMDSPPEVLLGQGDTNHWSAWQVSEEEIRLVVAPLLATVAHALTVGWLQPSIQQLSRRLGGLDPADFVVWFDTTPLELRPDRSADAKELHALGVLSDEALRRECGFTEDDKPDDDARVAALAKELLALRPDLVNELFELMGLPDPGLPSAPGSGGPVMPPDGAPPEAPADPEHETLAALADGADPRTLPDTQGLDPRP
ncbi:hypothetical protein FK268_12640 [Tsukamurella sputi]|uniref:Phage portal protein n=1 Tax=Tsukamurella sputi TaxID=2591848 RepID=A0A5C5RP28_9ACTN|nr:hypothetical protein [Tsukamurella sputi]TWS24430.1 hypothetical protein FK268_12640 [Tsukamurella sputi]